MRSTAIAFGSGLTVVLSIAGCGGDGNGDGGDGTSSGTGSETTTTVSTSAPTTSVGETQSTTMSSGDSSTTMVNPDTSGSGTSGSGSSGSSSSSTGEPAGGDGAGALVATLLRAANNNDFYFGGTVSPNVWPTNRDFTHCDFAATIDFAPGAGNQWTFTAEHATLAADQSCGDVVDWTVVPLCDIADDDRNCHADAVALDIVGPACLRGHAVVAPGNNVGQNGAGSGGTVSFHCYDDGDDGPVHFQGSGGSTPNGSFFAGNVFRNSDIDRAYWLNAGEPLASCSGVVAMPYAPGMGNTWHLELMASTAALASDQNCTDLGYVSTGDLCTIGDGDRHCAWDPAALDVPTGGCLQLRGTCTGGDCNSDQQTSPNYGLDCSTAFASPYDGGGPSYAGAGSGAFDAGHSFGVGAWGISDANQQAIQFSQQYWLAPPSGLGSCGGAITFQDPIGGSGQYDIGLTIGAAPAPGESCLDVTYDDQVALCSVAAGDNSCTFAPTAADVPPGGCFALLAGTSNGAPVAGGGNQFNWQVACTAP